MLRKTPLVTVVPPIEAQAYRAASYVCIRFPRPGTGGDGRPTLPPVPPPSQTNPAPGTPIILEDEVAEGQFMVYIGTAPPPAGFVCRAQTTFVTNYSDPMHPTVIYTTTCSRYLP